MSFRHQEQRPNLLCRFVIEHEVRHKESGADRLVDFEMPTRFYEHGGCLGALFWIPRSDFVSARNDIKGKFTRNGIGEKSSW